MRTKEVRRRVAEKSREGLHAAITAVRTLEEGYERPVPGRGRQWPEVRGPHIYQQWSRWPDSYGCMDFASWRRGEGSLQFGGCGTASWIDQLIVKRDLEEGRPPRRPRKKVIRRVVYPQFRRSVDGEEVVSQEWGLLYETDRMEIATEQATNAVLWEDGFRPRLNGDWYPDQEAMEQAEQAFRGEDEDGEYSRELDAAREAHAEFTYARMALRMQESTARLYPEASALVRAKMMQRRVVDEVQRMGREEAEPKAKSGQEESQEYGIQRRFEKRVQEKMHDG